MPQSSVIGLLKDKLLLEHVSSSKYHITEDIILLDIDVILPDTEISVKKYQCNPHLCLKN